VVVVLDGVGTIHGVIAIPNGPADVDKVNYWRPLRPANGDGGRVHAEYVTRGGIRDLARDSDARAALRATTAHPLAHERASRPKPAKL
jgi:hypothetical protein